MSIFGEIVEPLSRNAWEDWDDIDFQEQYSELCWKKDTEIPKDVEFLFILEGKYLFDCIKQSNELELVNSIPSVNLFLYKTQCNKYICILKNYNLIQSSEIVSKLLPFIKASKDITCIQTKALPEYQSNEMLNQADCIIRGISTSKNLKKEDFEKLEQPNIISGVTAGVLSYQEHVDLPGIAYVCFIENQEEYKITEVEKLLQKHNILKNIRARQETILNSNLYL